MRTTSVVRQACGCADSEKKTCPCRFSLLTGQWHQANGFVMNVNQIAKRLTKITCYKQQYVDPFAFCWRTTFSLFFRYINRDFDCFKNATLINFTCGSYRIGGMFFLLRFIHFYHSRTNVIANRGIYMNRQMTLQGIKRCL